MIETVFCISGFDSFKRSIGGGVFIEQSGPASFLPSLPFPSPPFPSSITMEGRKWHATCGKHKVREGKKREPSHSSVKNL